MTESNNLKNRLDLLLHEQHSGDMVQLFDALVEEFNDELNHSIELVALLGIIEEFYADKIPLDSFMDLIELGTENDDTK